MSVFQMREGCDLFCPVCGLELNSPHTGHNGIPSQIEMWSLFLLHQPGRTLGTARQVKGGERETHGRPGCRALSSWSV